MPFAFPENQDVSRKAESCPRLMCVTGPGPATLATLPLSLRAGVTVSRLLSPPGLLA